MVNEEEEEEEEEEGGGIQRSKRRKGERIMRFWVMSLTWRLSSSTVLRSSSLTAWHSPRLFSCTCKNTSEHIAGQGFYACAPGQRREKGTRVVLKGTGRGSQMQIKGESLGGRGGRRAGGQGDQPRQSFAPASERPASARQPSSACPLPCAPATSLAAPYSPPRAGSTHLP